MSVRVHVDIGNIASKAHKAIGKATFDLTNQVMKDSNYFIPKDKGDLERSALTASDPKHGHIVWDTPYARRLYYNPQYNFSKDVNQNARGKWFDAAKAQFGRQWPAAAQKAVNKYYGGS